MASLAMPESNSNALQWCEYIFQANGTLRMAHERVIAYFLTDVDIGSLSAHKQLGDDEKEKWETSLERLGYLSFVQSMDRDTACYGQGFGSVVVPFKRFLFCPKCKLQYMLREVHSNPAFKFDFRDYKFVASCPSCSFRGEWNVKDEPENTPDKIRLKRWSPHEIQILHCPFTDDVKYYWKIPEDYKKMVRGGKLHYIERVSLQVLEAIKHNQLFQFAPNVLYHMKEPTLAGVQNRGWGISRLITNFRQAWYVQVLHRYNESIALDYVIPFRLLTPSARGGSSAGGGQALDPLLSMNMGDFMGQVRSMVRKRRRDPAGWHTLPFPVEYQALGGDAQQLAPRELLDQGLETLLNASGTPVELYKGTLQLQTAPVSLRLFEATWYHLVHQNNEFLRWVVGRLSEILSWEQVDARHRRVTHADDMQRHMALLQLMMGQTISQTTGLKALGLDLKDEKRLIAEESRLDQEIQSELQEEMDQAAFGQQIAAGAPPMGGGMPGQPMDPAMGGGMPPGGAPAGGGAPPVDPATGMPAQPGPVTGMIMGGNTPQTPEDMMATAESIAQQLLGMPESQKDSELRALKQKNEVLHSLVRAKMDQIRGQARSQGGNMLMSQEFGGGMGGGMGGGPPAPGM